MGTPSIAVLGAGNWGINHVRNFHALGALRAVVDPTPAARDKAAQAAPGVALHADPAAVLADPAIDAVVLATPAANHVSDALAAIAAGKDVFVEKPMTLHVADAERIVAAAERAGRVLMVGHLLLYQPAIAWMRETIAAGTLGPVWHVETRRLNLGKVRAVENVFWSFAPHDLAVIRVLLGEPELRDVRAFGQRAIQGGVEDQVHADFAFAGGGTAHVHAAWFWPTRERRTTVIGSRGAILYDEIAQTVRLYRHEIDAATLATKPAGDEVVTVASSEPLKLECQHFLDCIARRARPLSDGRHGVEVVRMLERASQSLVASPGA